MVKELERVTEVSDPAAVFACALSLWQACQERGAVEPSLNLGESYNGMDQFMREAMRIATEFEAWACRHIDFAELDEVWPYLLQDRFGNACLADLFPTKLAVFDEPDCLRVALHLRLPVRLDDNLPLPILLRAPNPVTGSVFREIQIQTVRDSIEDGDAVPFTSDDDPFDEEFGPPYFGLYGIGEDGRLEHIADRQTYSQMLSLAQKLAPGVAFPTTPTVGRPLPQS